MATKKNFLPLWENRKGGPAARGFLNVPDLLKALLENDMIDRQGAEDTYNRFHAANLDKIPVVAWDNSNAQNPKAPAINIAIDIQKEQRTGGGLFGGQSKGGGYEQNEQPSIQLNEPRTPFEANESDVPF